MAGDTFSIGLSALRASQLGLATTGHNIANVNTDGYSRQRVSFETRDPQYIGVGFVGKGVDVQSIRRLANDFLVEQLRLSTANEAKAQKMTELVEQVDRQVGDGLVVSGLQTYFAALGDANDDPRVMATRQVLLESAQAVVSRFAEQEAQMNALSRGVNQQIRGAVTEINSLTDAIARLNIDIARAAGLATGEPANDLLDKRDQLLVELSHLVGVQTQQRTDGMVNVLIGDGQLVVTGGTASHIKSLPNALDASRMEIAFDVGGSVTDISSSITGGELGALLEFRDLALDPARSAIGRLAVSFAMTMNAEHRQGMDLNGALGGDLFNVPPPAVNEAAGNTGTIGLAFDPGNIAALTTSDYRLVHDGTNFTLTRLSDLSTQTLSGAGPFSFDGLNLTLTSAPAAGDQYLIQATKYAPRALTVALTDPVKLALALPIRTASANGNIGNGAVSRGEILDVTDAALLTTTQLVFNDPPTTYQVNGAGPLLAYTSGADIDLNGWRVQISGMPRAGDTFTVASNAGGTGDNSSGLNLSALQFAPLMVGGTASYQEAYGSLVGEIGATAQQSRISSAALGALTEHAQAARDALSGVNLEEEAGNLLRFQQAFQAAAQLIKAADTTFQSLLAAIRG